MKLKYYIDRVHYILPFLPLLHFYTNNFGRIVYVDTMWLPLIAISVGILMLHLILKITFNSNWSKNIIAISMFSILFFALGHFFVNFNPINDLLRPSFTERNYKTLAVLTLICTPMLIHYVLNTPKKLKIAQEILNVVTVVLIANVIGNIATKLDQITYTTRAVSTHQIKASTNEEELPNIYYIVLDGYTSPYMLKNLFGVDNTWFREELEKRGFFVPTEVRANYASTLLSLTATLNMDYIQNLTDGNFNKENFVPADLTKNLRNNKMTDLLREHGYTVVVFNSIIQDVDLDGDINVFPNGLLNNNTIIQLRHSTMLRALIDVDPLVEAHAKAINFPLDNLHLYAQDVNPRLVYAHLLAAHEPFIFDEKGEQYTFEVPEKERPLNIQGISTWYNKSYIKQIEYIQPKLLNTIDNILSNDPTAVFVIHGDHGSAWGVTAKENSDISIEQERLAAFVAIKLPTQDYSGINEDFSLINLNRIVLNNLLGTNYSLLEDSTYYSHYGKLFEFRDVTELVKSY